MDIQKDIQKHINNYIDVFTSDDVKMRGEKLYSRGVVDFKVYEERTDTWKFFVKGTQLYRVSIRGVKKDEIEASCTCPYSYGGVCKHTVASMLYILGIELTHAKIDIKKSVEKNMEKRGGRLIKHTSAGAVYELKEYEIIDKEFVLDNISQRVYNQLTFYSNFIELKKCDIAPEKASFVFVNEGVDVIIAFFKEDDKVWMSTSEFSQNDTFTHTLAYCLLMFAKCPTPDLLAIIFNGKLKQTETNLIQQYGLPDITDFRVYFEHYFKTDTGLTSTKRKEFEGLIPVVQNEIDSTVSFLNQQAGYSLSESDWLKNEKQLEVAFVLKQNEHEVEGADKSEKHYHIIPIVGKANKFGQLSTHIANYNVYEHAYALKTERVSKILDLLNYHNEDNKDVLPFNKLKLIFELLKKEKFVYGLKPNTYSIKKTNIQIVSLADDEIDLAIDLSTINGFITAELLLKKGENIVSTQHIDSDLSSSEIIVVDGIYHIVKNNKVCNYLASYPGKVQMVQEQKDVFFDQVIQPISKQFDFIFKDDTYSVEKIELDFNKKQLFLTEQDDYIVITPQVEYENDITAVLHSPGNILLKGENGIIEYSRNHELEKDFINSIAELHPEFEKQKSQYVFYLHNSEFAKNMWFYRFFEQLKVLNVEVYGLKDLKNFKYSPFKGKVDAHISSGEDWFEVDLNISFGDNKVALTDIRKAILNKQRYVQLNDGSVGVLPTEWYSKLEKYFRNGEIIDDKLAISKLRFSIIDDLFDSIDDMEVLNEIAQKRKKLESFTEIVKTEIPGEISAELRHYQKEGLNWLNFLHEMQWGGILADDMGLGKTLQILTFLQHLKNKQASTHLIVVPTTLLFNWEREIEKFAPTLKAFYHYGIDRQKNVEGFDDYDLVFTTYGLLLRDIEMLREFSFNYIILDESQAIKNPASRRYKAANLINAKNRIALSGTPIENSTFDLFAQMSFANRGFFNSAGVFKENYSNPIDKDGNELIGTELHKLINPFVLRRTKETVATELPDKTEDIIYCEMEPEQRRVYDAYRNSYRNQLMSKIETDGVGKSKMMVLEALTRLRQICDSPALVDQDYISDAQAVKVKEIIRHITNKTANHKILIFSQFVKMLGIVKNELTKLNVDFEYLDGKSTTRQREKSVNNFQENDDLRVFLISLKAGGTGLNLTAADYVYLLDPWWNPAVENQAIDRCYRIGQDKKVFAYRMICKNTVEEKILNLQNKKKKIAGDIIQTDENIMKNLTGDDIKDLFN